MKSKIVIPVLALVVTSSLLITTPTTVHAQTTNNNNSFSELVQMIAQKFNLDQAQVQGVFDQYKTQHQIKKIDNWNSKLDQDIKDGKITQAQKQLIISKRQELQNNRPDFKNLTSDQKKAAVKQQKTDLENWAKQNNIDIKYLIGRNMRSGRGMRMGWGM